MRKTGALEADAFVNAARDLLNQGDAIGAERILSPVLDQFRSDPPVMHLMGQIKKAQNNLDGAERYFRAAIAHGLSEGQYYNDLGVILQQRGQNAEAVRVFRAALVLMPHALMVRVNIVRCLLAAGELADAEREAQAYVDANPSAESWTLLGTVQRAQERDDAALATAETALKYGPNMRGLRYNHATALDRVGRAKEALEIYNELTAKELDTPDLAHNHARALYADGSKDDAEKLLLEGVKRWPAVATLHGTLARMRWLRGEGENCTALLEAEIGRRPQDLSLRLTCADALHRGQHQAKAARVLYEALRLAPESTPLLSAYGVVLDELDRPRDGLQPLRRVVNLMPTSRSAQRNLLSTLLRAGLPEEALTIVRKLREDDPDEQYLIACEATALRILGNAKYRYMCDYDRLVRVYEIPAPRGYFTPSNFNAALGDVLRTQHRVNAHPLDQHLHAGTQTGRSLLTVNDPVLKAFLAAVDDAVQDYISRLPSDGEHPMLRRKRERYRYASLWSLRLMNGGWQPAHVHDRGWLSSAYYVATSPAERPRDPHAGWLKIGEPNRPPSNCGPEARFEPRPGRLVLFPAYMWHGTVPFEGSERLSVSFDVTPG
ncbi:MAG: tetratricopeptide repeat protein [Hyphomonadaceae bacterium]